MVFTPSSMASYASYIARSKPVGWWGMNEAGGPALQTTADLSGAYGAAHNQAGVTLPLTYQSAGTASLTDQDGFVSGRGNRAAYFDGSSGSGAYNHSTNQYAGAFPGAIYRYESGFSVEVWVKAAGFVSADSARVIGVREWGFGYVGPNGPLHFTTFGKQDYFSTASLPADGAWHQLGVSWDGNVTATFYLDGVAAGTYVGVNAGLTPINNTSPNNRCNLGSRATDTQHFKGWVDEAVIWGHPRTAKDFWDSHEAALGASLGAPVLIIR
jgi:hypothetical protein